MESQQDKKVVSIINRTGVCLLFPDRREMGWAPFFPVLPVGLVQNGSEAF